MEEDGFDFGDEIEGGPLGSDDDEDEITWHEIAISSCRCR